MEEKVKVTELLLNILPQDIVTELQKSDIKGNTNKIISAKYDEATVLFADLVGFTELSSRLPAVTVVTILNDIFSVFDQLAEEHKMEKIKTIGGKYRQSLLSLLRCLHGCFWSSCRGRSF